MDKGKRTIADLRIRTAVAYSRILQAEIVTEADEHGRLCLVLELGEETPQDAALRIMDTEIALIYDEDKVLFSGVCVDAAQEQGAQYSVLNLVAYAHSCKADREPVTRTYQSPYKRFLDVADEALAASGALFHTGGNPYIPVVLYQENETDWAFVRRIANACGMRMYTDVRESGPCMAAGTQQMRHFPEEVLETAVSGQKDIAELRRVRMNDDPFAAAFQFAEMTCQCADITVTAGDTIGIWTVEKSALTGKGGILANAVTLKRTPDVMPAHHAATGQLAASSILEGEVMLVEGNEIEVQFDADAGSMAGNCVRVPYESAISNSFYCMPDEGDRVFLYYENNGTIICLGSRHTDTSHPDMETPEEKVLTSKDRMVRFTGGQVVITNTRKLHDAQDNTEISLVMDDGDGITITSGSDVCIESGESIYLTADSDDMPLMHAGNAMQSGTAALRYAASASAGARKYQEDGGRSEWEQKKLKWETYLQREGEKAAQNLSGLGDMLTFKALREAIFNGNKDGGADAPAATASAAAGAAGAALQIAEEAVPLFDGVISIYGLNEVTLRAGSSFITIDADILIYSRQFQWLGYTKGTHPIVEEEYQDFWGTVLDGVQLVLDLAGFIPGYGAFFDLASGAISLARGDMSGAVMSFVCAIPMLGDACAAAKMGWKSYMKAMKAAKGAATATKAMTKGQKISRLVRLLYQGGTAANQLVLIDEQRRIMMANEDFDLSNPNDLSMLLRMINSCIQTAHLVRNMASDAAAIKRGTVPDYGKVSDGPENGLNGSTKCIDPVDAVTGSLCAEYTDMCLADVLGDFVIRRHYESAYTNTGGMLGDKWRFGIEGGVTLSETRTHARVQMDDLHMEGFTCTDGVWESDRRGDRSLVFAQTDMGYSLKFSATGAVWEYDTQGGLVRMTDRHGNTTRITRADGMPIRLETASGQWVEFRYEHGRLVTLADNAGREVKYTYQGRLLHTVELPHGGTMSYEYTPEGWLKRLTDLNGRWYTQNHYDRRGRVVRQELETGEEFVIFYDDAARQNTFLTGSTGENIVYSYGREKLPTQVLHHDGTTECYRYDSGHNTIYEKDRLGRETTRLYNETGQPTEEHFPDGYARYTEYDGRGLATRIYDNAGREVTNTYDECGNLVKSGRRMDGNTVLETAFDHDAMGRITKVCHADGSVEEYRYDTPFSEPSEYRDAMGNVTAYEYDATGSMTAMHDPCGGTTRYCHNALGNRISVTDADGGTTRYVYDGMANLIREIRPEQYDSARDGGEGTQYAYDAWRNVKSIRHADGGLYTCTHDYTGRLLSEKTPVQNATGAQGTRYEYDADFNRIKTVYADGGVLREKHDACGNVTVRILPEQYDEKTDGGAGYSYGYDSRDRLVSVTGPDGATEHRYVYDPAGNLIKDITAKGCLTADSDDDRVGTVYTYDLTGNVTSVRIPVDIRDGSVRYRLTTYAYDKMARCTEEKRYLDYQDAESRKGRVHTINYTYDAAGRLMGVGDSTGACAEYRYDACGRQTLERIKIDGNTWKEKGREYSPAGRLIRITESADEKGCGRKYATTRIEYDKNGNPTRITTPLGNEILREYDSMDRLTAETHREKGGAIRNTTKYQYDVDGNIIRVTAGNGYATTHSYDLMDRLVSTADSMGSRDLRAYDRNGRMTRYIPPQEYAAYGESASGWRYTYDAYGRNTQTRTPEGSVESVRRYNAFGETEREGDAMGGVSFTHDFSGRRTHAVTDGGSTQQYEYDAMGNLTAMTDGNGNRTTYGNDSWGNVTTVTRPDGTQEEYAYDNAGNITAATDGNGNTTTYRYNSMNLLSERKDASGARESFFYDMEGRLCEHQDRDGRRQLYRHNMYGSPTLHENASDHLRESWEYDAMGRLTTATGGGMQYRYTYYDNGRLREKQASGRTLIAYAYDLSGNITSRRDLTGKETCYGYDRCGRLKSVTDNGRLLAVYTYHSDGRVESRTIADTIRTDFRYDADKNLTYMKTVDMTAQGRKLVWEEYPAYDHNGNMVEKRNLEGTTRYAYDANNQLVEVSYPGAGGLLLEKFGYDRAGNRLTRERHTVDSIIMETYHHDNCNRIKELNRRTYEPDGVTPKLKRQSPAVSNNPDAVASYIGETSYYGYDRSGNLLSDGNATYTYDGFGRTAEVKMANGNSQINRYDAEGLRAEMEENGQLVKFLFNGEKEVIAEETDGEVIRYIRGLGIISSDSESARTYYHYVSDNQGSIRLILTDTVNDRRIRNYYCYDAFGESIISHEDIHNRFRFNGEQYDLVTSQYYLRARFYNPVIGRFMQEDTYYGDGLNLYEYCRNNPMLYRDPSGHDAVNQGNLYRNDGSSTSINPDEIRFSQSSVNGANEIINSMKVNGWKGEAIDVVMMTDGKLTTIDNTRVLAARYAGIDVQAKVHAYDELLPYNLVERFTTPKGIPKTWGEAVSLRIGKQNSRYRSLYPQGSNIIGWSGN